MEGTGAVRHEVVARFEDALERGSATTSQLDIRPDRVVVDVTHTISNDLHTGIQRVVRESVSRWIEAGFPVDLAHFDFSTRSPRLLSHDEYERMTRWREHMARSGAKMATRVPREATGDVLYRGLLARPARIGRRAGTMQRISRSRGGLGASVALARSV